MHTKACDTKYLKNTSLKLLASITASLLFMSSAPIPEKDLPEFTFTETTIENIHSAIKTKAITCQAITQGFIDRITKYDEISNLNAIIYINPKAISKAKQMDLQFTEEPKLKPLQCIPVILKDNFDTADMPTEAGSIALKGSIPPDDAFIVKKLRDAGAIIIAKSNMGEWAFSPNNTISSTHGETHNAYDLSRVPAGSSGGTASAIAANFGVIGIGSDTGNSIRGPSSHLALVGMRSTIGATSRDGIIPLLLNRDVGGPMLRTIKDTARVFNAIAGYDEADPTTKAYLDHKVTDYTAKLSLNGLQGVRLGVLREIVDETTADKETLEVYAQALQDLAAQGAVIVDPITIPEFEKLTKATGFCSRFRYDLNNYLATLTSRNEIKTLQDVVAQKKHRPENSGSMNWAMKVPANITPAEQTPPCVDVQGDPRRKALLNAVVNTMDNLKLDAIVYPTWSNPPRKIGDSQSPSGNNSGKIAPHTGQPAITVPMGYVKNGLPVGLQILGRPFTEDKLFQYAYAYEQATMHRRAPLLFP
ncbi:amidase family protein [uncultured Paraglaciecola sp.]|uniref:amidase n=1 Tax=uncultured Paraglaciecola sp. TaxID=1765024 RepID=UPI00259ADF0A|nr:amidase family protein [uncultured Paraglaciecola sp.]